MHKMAVALWLLAIACGFWAIASAFVGSPAGAALTLVRGVFLGTAAWALGQATFARRPLLCGLWGAVAADAASLAASAGRLGASGIAVEIVEVVGGLAMVAVAMRAGKIGLKAMRWGMLAIGLVAGYYLVQLFWPWMPGNALAVVAAAWAWFPVRGSNSRA